MRAAASSALALLAAVASAMPAVAEVNRVVILKVDGLPEDLLERFEVADGLPQRLPWISHVFGRNGARLDNFYVRGLSLSAPSWSLLDTGRHLEIRGNAEYDRYNFRVYDYLNFFPFYLGSAASRADMPGVELLDQRGVPLLIDRFPPEQRYQGFQLLQRGVRWKTLRGSLMSRFTSRSLKELFDEWQTGFSMSSSVNEQTERELIAALNNPQVRYLDYFTGEFDHLAHLTEDRVTQRHALESLEALVGRVWTAISQSPLARTTALVLVSDHGMNTHEGIYSQGYNLVDWFASAAGGAHHVVTNRHPMTEFKIKGLYPFVSEVVTPSPEPAYLAGQSARYPTVVLDLDGNERASIGLRNNQLNMLHILLDQLTRRRLPGRVRNAAIDAFFEILDRNRPAWRRDLDELVGREYSSYAAAMSRLLGLDPSDFDPGKFKIEELIPPRSLGPSNSIHDLAHYVTGPGPNGMVLGADGSLDLEKSFRTVDYFAALSALSVRNNVQKEVSSHPVDFIAVRTPTGDGIWLWGGADRQALILTRRDEAGRLELHYAPMTRWSAGLPLALFEDPMLDVPPESRETWLNQWHDEREWFRAVHRTRYSNGIIGLAEQLLDTAPSRRTDLLVFARDHWNFNVRGFNPGGNHGSFLRASTHSVLLAAGGDDTGIPRGLRIAEPYDSLSFVPTILALMGRPEPELPGPVITELLPK